MGKKSRTKGNVWMRKVAGDLRRLLCIDIHKGDQGRQGSDVGDVDAPACPVWIECKHAGTVAKANPYKALVQAQRDTDGRPVVAFCKVGSQKGDRYEPLMAVPYAFGLELLACWHTMEKHTPAAGGSMRLLIHRIIDGDEPDPFPIANRAALPPPKSLAEVRKQFEDGQHARCNPMDFIGDAPPPPPPEDVK